jgi:hypothetical protein
VLSKLFRWQPDRGALLAIAAGLVSVGLSLAMVPLARWPWASIFVRDVLQVIVVGTVLPLLYVRRSSLTFADFGLSTRRWPLFLAINLALAAALFFLLRSSTPPPADFVWSAAACWKAAYVLLAVTFECLFFYSFLRTLLERSFGIVPAVALAALFYAFHHAGFQPEFGKLFFVGVLYAAVFRLGNSALLIWPFFIGVGGVYDVLIKSRVVSDIAYPEFRVILLAILMAAAAAAARWWTSSPDAASATSTSR